MTRSVDPELAPAMSYALALANRGYMQSQIVDALWKDRVVHLYLEANGKGATDKLTQRLARNAINRAKSHPVDEWRSDAALRIVRAREAADQRPWDGRTGPTDRRVLEAAFTRAAETPISTLFFLSSRQWGNRAGISWSTTNGAVKRLTGERGALFTVSPGSRQARRAARYRIRVPRAETRTGTTPPVPCASFPLTDPTYLKILQHDAFRSRALGDSGWMVLHRLDPEEAVKPRDLARSIGLSWDRTRGALGELHAASLARPTADGWVRVADLEEIVKLLDLVAITRGTAGALARDSELYAIDQAREDTRFKFGKEPPAGGSLYARETSRRRDVLSPTGDTGNSHIRTHAEAAR